METSEKLGKFFETFGSIWVFASVFSLRPLSNLHRIVQAENFLRSYWTPLGVYPKVVVPPQIRYKLDNTLKNNPKLYVHFPRGQTPNGDPPFWINGTTMNIHRFHLLPPSLSDNPCSPMESWVAVRLEEPSVVSQAEAMFASEKHPTNYTAMMIFGRCISFRCISFQIWQFLVSM